MIGLPLTLLDPSADRHLLSIQSVIDQQAGFEGRVAEAKKRWKNKSASNAGERCFQTVKLTLETMCQGARRCAYCEDSLADEIEHVWPKSFYPGLAFAWINYLYACGPCNGRKRDRFALFVDGSQTPVELQREQEPQAGHPVFIDPRTENPLDFLRIDILHTFMMFPRSNLGDRDLARAKFTVEALRLDEGTAGHLIKARRVAYGNYLARLKVLVAELEDPTSAPDAINRQIHQLGEMDHRSVWHEMKRSRGSIPELAELFNRCPQALTW